jgi:hypothetical protein
MGRKTRKRRSRRLPASSAVEITPQGVEVRLGVWVVKARKDENLGAMWKQKAKTLHVVHLPSGDRGLVETVIHKKKAPWSEAEAKRLLCGSIAYQVARAVDATGRFSNLQEAKRYLKDLKFVPLGRMRSYRGDQLYFYLLIPKKRR